MTAGFRERFESDYGPPFVFPHGGIEPRADVLGDPVAVYG